MIKQDKNMTSSMSPIIFVPSAPLGYSSTLSKTNVFVHEQIIWKKYKVNEGGGGGNKLLCAREKKQTAGVSQANHFNTLSYKVPLIIKPLQKRSRAGNR